MSVRVRSFSVIVSSSATDVAWWCRFPPFVSNSVRLITRCPLTCTLTLDITLFTVLSTRFPMNVSSGRRGAQRHVTRQKILNWKQSLKFPSRPRVSREGVDLMQQLLCEPEDRLGSQASASVNRPNSIVVQARRSGFIAPNGATGSVDGAHLIKASPYS